MVVLTISQCCTFSSLHVLSGSLSRVENFGSLNYANEGNYLLNKLKQIFTTFLYKYFNIYVPVTFTITYSV